MDTPFTYLIKCVPTGQFYYGVRYARGCKPSDLWTTYFTSSKFIKRLIETYGKDNFIFEVRKTFVDRTAALNWEKTTIRRMKAKFRPDFINRHDGTPLSIGEKVWVTNDLENRMVDPNEISTYIEFGWKPGRFFDEKHRTNLSISRRKNPSAFKGKTHSQKSRDQMSLVRKGRCTRPTCITELDGVTYPSFTAARAVTGKGYDYIKKHGVIHHTV